MSSEKRACQGRSLALRPAQNHKAAELRPWYAHFALDTLADGLTQEAPAAILLLAPFCFFGLLPD